MRIEPYFIHPYAKDELWTRYNEVCQNATHVKMDVVLIDGVWYPVFNGVHVTKPDGKITTV